MKVKMMKAKKAKFQYFDNTSRTLTHGESYWAWREKYNIIYCLPEDDILCLPKVNTQL